jgi:hypothetical protein
METTLSQKACDELAVKIGKNVSKLQCIIATSKRPSQPSGPAHHMLSWTASSPSAVCGGHGPPIQDHHALFGRAALSEEVGDLVALVFPC